MTSLPFLKAGGGVGLLTLSCRARSSVAKRDRNTAMSLSATEKSRDCLNSNLHATPFSPRPPRPPPHPTCAIKSTKTPPISLEFVLRACGLYELSFTRLGALFMAVLSCFSPDFVLLRPQPRRDRHPTFSRPSGTPPSFARKAHTLSAHHLRSAAVIWCEAL
jgi:hypothetical protein